MNRKEVVISEKTSVSGFGFGKEGLNVNFYFPDLPGSGSNLFKIIVENPPWVKEFILLWPLFVWSLIKEWKISEEDHL